MKFTKAVFFAILVFSFSVISSSFSNKSMRGDELRLDEINNLLETKEQGSLEQLNLKCSSETQKKFLENLHKQIPVVRQYLREQFICGLGNLKRALSKFESLLPDRLMKLFMSNEVEESNQKCKEPEFNFSEINKLTNECIDLKNLKKGSRLRRRIFENISGPYGIFGMVGYLLNKLTGGAYEYTLVAIFQGIVAVYSVAAAIVALLIALVWFGHAYIALGVTILLLVSSRLGY